MTGIGLSYDCNMTVIQLHPDSPEYLKNEVVDGVRSHSDIDHDSHDLVRFFAHLSQQRSYKDRHTHSGVCDRGISI